MNRSTLACLAALLMLASGPAAHADIILSGTLYEQDFDSLGSGLPTGVSVRTGATGNSLGSSVAFDPALQAWSNSSGAFKNFANSALGSSATTIQQSTSSDRLLGIRQTGSFGDPGAAFTFRIVNTLGFSDFTLGFESHILSEQGRDTSWTTRWGSGESPTSFTNLGTFTQSAFGKIDRSFSLGSAFGNSGDVAWIQVATLADSTGGGSRDSFGIDNVQLSYSAVTSVPEPTSMLLVSIAAAIGLAGRGAASCRRHGQRLAGGRAAKAPEHISLSLRESRA